MNENRMVEQFNRDLDVLLNNSKMRKLVTPSEYAQELELAQILAQADFSSESRIRENVRVLLLGQINAPKMRLNKGGKWQMMSQKLRTTVVYAAFLLAAFLTLAMISPDTLTSVAQGIYNIIQRIAPGPNTTVLQIEHDHLPETRPADDISVDDHWGIYTDIGNHGGNLPPGVDATVHTLTNVADAQELVSFQIRSPAYLPEGYALYQVQVSPIDSVFLYYQGPAHDIILIETSVGIQPDDDGDPSTVTSVASMTITDGKLTKVIFNDQPGVWLEDVDNGGNSLQWELDGMNYTLGGINLTLDEVLQIAVSIE